MYSLVDVKYRDIIDIGKMSFEKGVVSFITGRSGSGKTTLLKLLNRMITPDRGDVLFKGINVKDIDPVALRRRAAMLPQSPVIFEGNVEHNLSIGAVFSGKPVPGRKVMA
ncbi:MAG: ATP-binding cassette domain-containing protein, partial [Elusimicrobiota bacterium]